MSIREGQGVIRETHHRVHQALVAVAEIGRQPSRGLVNGLGGPLAIRQVQGIELAVFLGRVLEPTGWRELSQGYVLPPDGGVGSTYMGILGELRGVRKISWRMTPILSD